MCTAPHHDLNKDIHVHVAVLMTFSMINNIASLIITTTSKPNCRKGI